ncbi:unnamed protein product [Darwinula stevensoni]|uniref:Uncharacterized protein n=1 Tax=Darwinula stevensoni TaxID=69355 RepID=A0A7R9AG17_9CRUS|nr:unnamed protein product [Darwinula stevensoni]CAG0903388.1 unnamed protein product [Darwinula stevensoni]
MRKQELAWIPPPIVKIVHPVKCIVCNEAVGCRPFQNSLLILPGDSTDCASETREESASLAESTESSTLVESEEPTTPSKSEGEAEDVNSVSLTVSRTHQFAIKSNWEELIESMDVERVENHMITKDKLPLHKREELNMEKVKKKRRSVLLHYVHGTDEDVFLAFQDGLVAADQAHLAKKLHP